MLGDGGENVLPGAFLNIAERYDLVQELDRWVAAKAISIVEAQLEVGESLTLANLSGKSLGDAELLEVIEHELQRRGSADVGSGDRDGGCREHQPRPELRRPATALGCRFALDDFGRGFGPSTYLKHIPFDYCKDRR